MYADKDSRGLISVFEMDRPEWSALRGACQMAKQLWEVQLTEFAGLETARMQTWEIQRKCHLEQCVGFARKLIHEIGQANARANDDSRRGVVREREQRPALDPFDL